VRGPEFSALVITHHSALLDQHRAGSGVCAVRRAYRALRRPGSGARTGSARLRRDGGRSRRDRCRDAARLRTSRRRCTWARPQAFYHGGNAEGHGAPRRRVPPRQRGTLRLLWPSVALRSASVLKLICCPPPPAAVVRRGNDRRDIDRQPTASSRVTQACATVCQATAPPAMPPPKRSAAPGFRAAASRPGNTPTCARSASAAFHEPLSLAGDCAACWHGCHTSTRLAWFRGRAVPCGPLDETGTRVIHAFSPTGRNSARSPAPIASRWQRSTPCWRKTAPSSTCRRTPLPG